MSTTDDDDQSTEPIETITPTICLSCGENECNPSSQQCHRCRMYGTPPKPKPTTRLQDEIQDVRDQLQALESEREELQSVLATLLEQEKDQTKT